MAALAGVSSALLLAAPSYGATLTVTNGNDSGAGSLRQAITDANTNGNGATVDQIPINGSGTINLLTALPNLSTPMTITGPGADSLDVQPAPAAPNGTRLFVVSPAATQTVTIEGMTISDGTDRALLKGGAGALVLDAVWLTNNQTTASGGAVHCDGGSLSIRNSTLSVNQANFGGGISVNSNVGAMTACVADVVDSTISVNSAKEFGGGVYVGGTGQVTINSSTIQGNTADSDNAGGGSGGGSYKASAMASITVANTLYAGNKIGTTSPVANQCGGAHTSFGHNLRQTDDVGCTGFTGTGDIVNANPMLGPLGDNGGSTPTIAPLTGSPAIDKGNPDTPLDGLFPTCPSTDQRGVSRLGPNLCDIGAFEKRSPTTTALACSPSSLILGSGSSACTATVTDIAGLVSPGGQVSFKTNGNGTFTNAGTCMLVMSTTTTASCSVSYVPGAVGTGSHLVSGFYEGTPDLAPSDDSDSIAVAPPPQPVTPVSTGASFDLKAAIKKCKKKFPKGKKRKKCIKRAKKRAAA